MRIIALVLTGIVTLSLMGCSQATPTPSAGSKPQATAIPAQSGGSQPVAKKKTYSAPPAMSIDVNKTITASMVTNKGTMEIELFAKEVPITVNNFVFLSREGYYNSVVFHRIIKGFMIQGGDPIGTGTGGPGYSFKDEPVTRKYVRGTLAMANAGPNTNGSQFFIVHQDYPLPPNYTIFGVITKGLDVLDALASTPVVASSSGEQSKPIQAPYIERIEITEK